MPSKIVSGVNDMATTHPNLAAEWHPNLNLPKTPETTRAGTASKIWWLCLKDERHVWQATGDNRAAKMTGCPICSNQLVVPGVNDLGTLYPLVASQWATKKNAGKKPSEVSAASPKRYWWTCNIDASHQWQASVFARTRENSGCSFCDGKRVMPGSNDFASTHPELVAEWDKVLNKNTAPSQVHAGSTKKIWWRCKVSKNHVWEASLASRTRKKSGCPICSNKVLIPGVNDMQTTHPELAKEWHPHKNGRMTPSDVFAGTGRKVWWACGKDSSHEWLAPAINRFNGTGCPVCSGRQVLSGQNDLATLAPRLALELHPIKNGSLTAESLRPGSHKRVWWRCSSFGDHEWQATVAHRERTGCPVCAGRKILVGFNDLASRNPLLSAEWHPTKNHPLETSEVAEFSHRSVWWQCAKKPDHEWKASIASRRMNGCPICSNKMLLLGFNDLATVNAELAAQWNFTRNGSLLPSNVFAGSSAKVWWTCRKHPDHEWQAAISSRKSHEFGCPICANLEVKAGFNDFATTNPGLASEWSSSMNGDLRSDRVVSGSNRVVWWECVSVTDHKWRASVKNRMSGTGCPSCSAKGFRTTEEGLLYFIVNEELRAMKIGITNPSARSDRLKTFASKGWTLLRSWRDSDGLVILNAETSTLRWIRRDVGLPPFLNPEQMGRSGGWSETFSGDALTSKVVSDQVEKNIEIARRSVLTLDVSQKPEKVEP